MEMLRARVQHEDMGAFFRGAAWKCEGLTHIFSVSSFVPAATLWFFIKERGVGGERPLLVLGAPAVGCCIYPVSLGAHFLPWELGP